MAEELSILERHVVEYLRGNERIKAMQANEIVRLSGDLRATIENADVLGVELNAARVREQDMARRIAELEARLSPSDAPRGAPSDSPPGPERRS